MPTTSTIDDVIHEGLRRWFLLDMNNGERVNSQLLALDPHGERTKAWCSYFESCDLHFSGSLQASGTILRALQGTAAYNGEKLLQAVVVRNLSIQKNMSWQGDPFKDLENALHLAESVGDMHTEGTILFNLGLTAFRFNDEGAAERYYQQARDRFVQVGDEIGEFRALQQLTALDIYLEDDSRFGQVAGRLHEIATSQEDSDLKIAVLETQATHNLYAGRYREVVSLIEEVYAMLLAETPVKVRRLSWCEFMIANVYWSMSEHKLALEWAHRSLETVKNSEGNQGELAPSSVISGVLAEIGEFEESLKFGLRENSILERSGSATNQLQGCLNIANTYLQAGDTTSSLEWLDQAEKHFDSDTKRGAYVTAELLVSRFKIFSATQQIEFADRAAAEVVEILPNVKTPRARVDCLNIAVEKSLKDGNVQAAQEYLDEFARLSTHLISHEVRQAFLSARSLVEWSHGDLDSAIATTKERIELTRMAHLSSRELEAQERLLMLYKAKQDVSLFFEQFELLDELRRKVRGEERRRQMLMISVEREMTVERQQSAAREQLLNNVLPTGIAERLLGGETVIADDHDDVAVFFLDIVSFTNLASNVPPGHVVHLLNVIFEVCDQVMRDHKLTKIKTIGDAYLAVAGAPRQTDATADRAEYTAAAASAAMDLKRKLDTLEVTLPEELGDTSWVRSMKDIQVRMGLHVGTVVAGVVGVDRVAYDVWGDAVNIASRLEQTCEPGRIQVSDDFAKSLPGAERPTFDEHDHVILKTDVAILHQRGNIPIKGKGDIKTWWLA